MRRRDLIKGLTAGWVTIWPLGVSAQRPRAPVIGYLSSISKDGGAFMLSAFRRGLAELGFVEHQNVTFLYRYADGEYDRLPTLAAELVARGVDVIVTGPSSPAAVAAKHATSTIPIVFHVGADPIGLGLVASYNRPGGNVTGLNESPESLTAKRMELLDDLVPKSAPVAELINPANKVVDAEVRVAEEAARTLGRELLLVGASTDTEIASALEELGRKHIGGLIIWFEALFQNNRVQIISLANQYGITTVCPTREFTEIGGLISYGPNVSVSYRQIGAYVGKILKGARPADLPVMTPETFDFVVNLRAAKALGVVVPDKLLVDQI
jgi:putative tryptophan/tyrosine transport system substrate-binding protein